MAVTRIVANLTAPDPMALAKFYEKVFELDLPYDMGWIAFLSIRLEDVTKIEAMLPSLCGGIFHGAQRGLSAHHSFFHRISASHVG